MESCNELAVKCQIREEARVTRQKQVEAYIRSKANAWSQTTQKSERARLRAVYNNYGELVERPLDLFRSAVLSPYAKKTTFIRLSGFYAWLQDNKQITENIYERFIRDNALLFKNAYIPERLSVSFDEAYTRICTIEAPDIRAAATALLHSGMRIGEIQAFTGDSTLGKGSKARRIFYSGDVKTIQGVKRDALRRALKSVGLKPHTLRKLFATRLVEQGAKEADLLAIMGWRSMQTAASYLQPRRDDELAALVNKAIT